MGFFSMLIEGKMSWGQLLIFIASASCLGALDPYDTYRTGWFGYVLLVILIVKLGRGPWLRRFGFVSLGQAAVGTFLAHGQFAQVDKVRSEYDVCGFRFWDIEFLPPLRKTVLEMKA